MNDLLSPYQKLKRAGVRIENHNSDMYCPKTAETTRLLRDVAKSVFISPLDNKPWYDVSFMYDPYWEALENGTKRQS